MLSKLSPCTSIFTGGSVGGPPSSCATSILAPGMPVICLRISSLNGNVCLPSRFSYSTNDTCIRPKFGCTLLLLSLGLFALTATLVMILSTMPPGCVGSSFARIFCTLPSNTCVMLSVYLTSVPTGNFRYT